MSDCAGKRHRTWLAPCENAGCVPALLQWAARVCRELPSAMSLAHRLPFCLARESLAPGRYVVNGSAVDPCTGPGVGTLTISATGPIVALSGP